MHWEIKKSCSFNGGPWIKGLKQCSGGRTVGSTVAVRFGSGLRQIERRRGPGRVRDHQFQEMVDEGVRRGGVNGGETLKVLGPLA